MEIFAACMFCLGAADHLTGDHLKMGPSFREGFSTIPELLLLMTGFMVLAPWLGTALAPLLTPFFLAIGCDPSSFAGMLLGCDAGAAVLAKQLALDPLAGFYNGMIVGSYVGCTVGCTIPLALSNTSGKKQVAAVNGLVVGFILLPFACVVTGLFCGIPLSVVLPNTYPVFVVAAVLLCFCIFCTKVLVKVFVAVSLLVRGIALFGFCIAILQEAFHIQILYPITPLNEVFPVICRIGVFLAGMLCFIAVLRRAAAGPLQFLAKKMQMESESVMAFFLSLANTIPVLTTLESRSEKAIMLNVAFATIAGFSVGDHLAFALQFSPEIAVPFMISKIICGLMTLAVAVAASNKIHAKKHIIPTCVN